MPNCKSAQSQRYVGRFAPTPSGPLHLGSLLTAVGSYLDAHHHQGQWLVRMEDIDRPRCKPGADSAILSTLELYGLHWDGPVVYQSRRLDYYQQFLEKLTERSLIYPCHCSRKQLEPFQGRYPGLCRHRTLPYSTHHDALRFLLPDKKVSFTDRSLGLVQQNPYQQFGDIIVKRKDNLFAYHFAVVVDDWLQNVTDIVRGRDLLDQTGIHWLLQESLEMTHPRYAHLPLVVDAHKKKLSKSEGARPLSEISPEKVLFYILKSFDEKLVHKLTAQTPVKELLLQATALWNPDQINANASLSTKLLLA